MKRCRISCIYWNQNWMFNDIVAFTFVVDVTINQLNCFSFLLTLSIIVKHMVFFNTFSPQTMFRCFWVHYRDYCIMTWLWFRLTTNKLLVEIPKSNEWGWANLPFVSKERIQDRRGKQLVKGGLHIHETIGQWY